VGVQRRRCSRAPAFYDPAGGREFLIEGQDIISRVTAIACENAIAVSSRTSPLFSTLHHGKEKIRYALSRRQLTRWSTSNSRGQSKLRFHCYCPRRGHDRLAHRGVKLSGGQRQRFRDCPSFSEERKCSCWMRATSALDTDSKRLSARVVNSLNARLGR